MSTAHAKNLVMNNYPKKKYSTKRKNPRKKQFSTGYRVTSSSDLRSQIAPKSISQSRKDISDWQKALKLANLAENPKWHTLQQLLDVVCEDALLSSQYENRLLKVLGHKGYIYNKDGKIDEKQSELIQNALFTEEINTHIFDSNLRFGSLVEFYHDKNTEELKVELISRDNVDPRNGYFYPNYTDDKHIKYRELKEYGTWLLEFGSHKKGLFNKAVPHVLFKKFAQSCYSELCEIYAIPPRVLKTDTADTQAMERGKKMMRDLGAAAWFIIDEHESFEFAQGVSTNGDVYNNLIKLCNNEMSLLISGAIIGQDTKHGNRSKEDSSKDMLNVLISRDLIHIAKQWNTKIIPALKNIGFLKGEVYYGYEPTQDLELLWKITSEVLPYKEVDNDWFVETFGVKVIADKKKVKNQDKDKLSLNGNDFFI